MVRRSRQTRNRVRDGKLLEAFAQTYNQRPVIQPFEDVKRLLKGAFINAFFVGPLVSIVPEMTWFELVSHIFIYVISANGMVWLFLSLGLVITYKRYELLLFEQSEIQRRHFVRTWEFLFLGWLSLSVSLSLLLATVGILVRLPGRVWVYPLVVYLLIALGLWLGRREIPRASVEGPRDHPWLWPVRIFFSISLGTCTLMTAFVRIFIQVLERRDVTLALLFLAILTFSLVPLFLGFAAWAWILAYLHHQKWRGVEELRL